MISEETRSGIRKLIDSTRGRTEYTIHSSYGYIPCEIEIEARDWGSVSDACQSEVSNIVKILTTTAMNIPPDMTREEYIEDKVRKATGLHDFSFLKQGSQTTILLARSNSDLSVLRICAHPDFSAKYLPNYKDDCVRPEFPGLLQPKHELIDIDQVLQVEVLPAVQALELNHEERNALQRFLQEITAQTCYEPALVETMVLPDGTLIGVDPGEMPYKKHFWELSLKDKKSEENRSLDLISERQVTWNIPEQLKWFDPEGTLKQDLFFEPDLTITAQPRKADSHDPNLANRFDPLH